MLFCTCRSCRGDLLVQCLAPCNALGGFSTRWYVSLLADDELLAAAFLSLRIAIVSATLATALGALVALALHRVQRLRGRILLSGMVTAPLVMPEIVTGLSLLFLFISMANVIGWPATGRATTVTIAHITFSMAYVVVVVGSRLAALDESLEEAAMDLAASRRPSFSTSRYPCCCRPWFQAGCCRLPCSLDDLGSRAWFRGPGPRRCRC